MSLDRYKRNPEGLRQFVELLESLDRERREKIVQVSMDEDPVFTKLAVDHIMKFDDILKLPDMELTEVIGSTPPQMVGFAVQGLPENLRDRILKSTPNSIQREVRDAMETPGTPRDIGSGRGKMMSVTRELEKKGLVKAKPVPLFRPNPETPSAHKKEKSPR